MKRMLLTILLTIFLTFNFSCKKDFSPLNIDHTNDVLNIPDTSLTVSEILTMQKITTLHYIEWDSIITNNNHHYSSSINKEVYLDKERLRQIQYYDNKPWIITVIDLKKWDVWQYDLFYDNYVDIKFLDTLNVFQNLAKSYLLSRIQHPIKILKFENIKNKKCNLVKDSYDNLEWIWIEHMLPIKWKKVNYPDGIKVEINGELKKIEVNINLADSLFTRPK
ncbi:hypothetical protein [Lutibacter sp.]